jgi:hypothetical protein
MRMEMIFLFAWWFGFLHPERPSQTPRWVYEAEQAVRDAERVVRND